MEKITMEKLVNNCKQYGFIFQGSEIYNGLANSWDYGPLGVELKNNIKKCWWKRFVEENNNSYGLDAAILMNPEVWVASGHVSSFSDPLIDCKKCKARHRADKLIEEFTNGNETGDGWDNEKIEKFINDNHIKCPKCGECDFTHIRQFNLLFETHMGVTEDTKSKVYLRGETAQGIFVNFLNVQRTMRAKLPFGIGQIGKAFRNEITPGNFIFRTREFEQMEYEFFCKPGEDLKWFEYYQDYCMKFLSDIGLKEENLRLRKHKPEELVFYSKGTTREIMKFAPTLAPYKVAVLPLIKKHHSEKAIEIYQKLSKKFMCTYDESGNIGKRYRREDAIGTPFCITIDDNTLNNNTVTLRDRDTMEQITLNLDEIEKYIEEKISF